MRRKYYIAVAIVGAVYSCGFWWNLYLIGYGYLHRSGGMSFGTGVDPSLAKYRWGCLWRIGDSAVVVLETMPIGTVTTLKSPEVDGSYRRLCGNDYYN